MASRKQMIGPEPPPPQDSKKIIGPFLTDDEYQETHPNNGPVEEFNQEEFLLNVGAPQLDFKQMQRNVTSFSRKGTITPIQKLPLVEREKLKERDAQLEQSVEEFNLQHNRAKSLLEIHEDMKRQSKKDRLQQRETQHKDKHSKKDKKDKKEKKDKRDKKRKREKDKQKDKEKRHKVDDYEPFFDRERDVVNGSYRYDTTRKTRALKDADSLKDRFTSSTYRKYM